MVINEARRYQCELNELFEKWQEKGSGWLKAHLELTASHRGRESAEKIMADLRKMRGEGYASRQHKTNI